MIALLLVLPAQAIDRESVMWNAALFSTHQWTMSSSNQYGSCSSSYMSDYTPGSTYRGIPYDWGGWVTTDEYDDALAAGYGAGSHSWHGVLSCTVGVDCSGFVSQAWETTHKYGTSTISGVSSGISSSSLKRGDALNKASSHIVLYAYETSAGVPVHFEANGGVVFVDSDQGWSSFSSYEPIRYDSISEGSKTGTSSNPIEIDAFPYEDLRWTAGAASDAIDSYACSSADESGPEQLYRFTVASAGQLTLRVTDDSYTDVDIHVMSAASGSSCLERDDTELSLWLEPGEYWIAADTWVGSYEYAGPYILTGEFTGSLGESSGSTEDEDSQGSGSEDSGSDQDTAVDGDTGEPGAADTGAEDWDVDFGGPGQLPGPRHSLVDSGCASTGSQGGGVLALFGLLLLGRRTRQRVRPQPSSSG